MPMPRLQFAVICLLCLTGQFCFAFENNELFFGPVACGANTVAITYHDDIDTPFQQCVTARFGSNSNNLTRSLATSVVTGANGRTFNNFQHMYSGTDTQGIARTFSVYQYSCTNVQDKIEITGTSVNAVRCLDTTTAAKTEDIVTFSGYLIGSFFMGYAFGYMFRVFYKIADHV